MVFYMLLVYNAQTDDAWICSNLLEQVQQGNE